MKKTFCLVILLAFITLNANAQQKPSFIPQPDNVAWMEGSFLIDKKLSLSIESATLRPAADYLSEIIAKSTGITPRMKKRGGTIRLALADNIAAGGYMLNISPKLITITGGDYQGVVGGSLLQDSRCATLSVARHGTRLLTPLLHETGGDGVA